MCLSGTPLQAFPCRNLHGKLYSCWPHALKSVWVICYFLGGPAFVPHWEFLHPPPDSIWLKDRPPLSQSTTSETETVRWGEFVSSIILERIHTQDRISTRHISTVYFSLQTTLHSEAGHPLALGSTQATGGRLWGCKGWPLCALSGLTMLCALSLDLKGGVLFPSCTLTNAVTDVYMYVHNGWCVNICRPSFLYKYVNSERSSLCSFLPMWMVD